jgi:large subunit ribosomal protein L10
MSKRIKEMLVTELQQRLGETDEMLVVDSSRLDAISDNRFRLALREKDICVLTVKNSMAMRALHSRDVTALDPILAGPSSLVFGGEDIVSLSKEIASWVKEIGGELLEIKGGMLEGTTLTASDVDELSKSPSREELIGQIVGLLLSPGASIAGSLLGPGGLVAGAIEAMGDGDAEAESAADEPETAEETAEAPAEETAEEPAESEDTDAEGGQESDSEE